LAQQLDDITQELKKTKKGNQQIRTLSSLHCISLGDLSSCFNSKYEQFIYKMSNGSKCY